MFFLTVSVTGMYMYFVCQLELQSYAYFHWFVITVMRLSWHIVIKRFAVCSRVRRRSTSFCQDSTTHKTIKIS